MPRPSRPESARLVERAGFGSGTAGSGLGLANIRERLVQMFGGGASLELRARPEGGVVATLTLPAA